MEQGGLIAAVDPGGIAAEIGLEPGDRLLAINGHPLRDEIDYRYYGAEEELELLIERQGEQHLLQVERDEEEELGLAFAAPLFDALCLCNNLCPFCFVAQMPRGLRRTLTLRDDDYRTSFLQGSFVTLTNLSEADWQRISAQRLTPLYVSIHATDLAARRRVLGNPNAPDILAQLRRLGELRIAVHGQIVLAPGLNDGAVLERSLADLLALWPTVRTLALVPVGLTRYHRGGVLPLGAEGATAALEVAARWAAVVRARTGCTWLYPADELFLLAGQAIPPTAFYDDDAQQENGVGLVRGLLDDWARAARRLRRRKISLAGQTVTLVCGASIAPTLRQLGAALHSLTGLGVDVVAVPNRFFGESVTVSGLLTGADVLAALEGRALGQGVILPRAMFDAAARLTLDDLTLAELQERLGVPVAMAGTLSEVMQIVQP
jgi:putative radical SAM enzyme (TIGR03279 family)